MLLSTKGWRKHGGWLVFMGNLWPTRGLIRGVYFTNSSTRCLSLGSVLGISTNYLKVLKNWEVVWEDSFKCRYLEMSLMNVDSWIWVLYAPSLLGKSTLQMVILYGKDWIGPLLIMIGFSDSLELGSIISMLTLLIIVHLDNTKRVRPSLYF